MYDTDDSLSLRVNSLLAGENLKKDRPPSNKSRKSKESSHGGSQHDASDELLHPMVAMEAGPVIDTDEIVRRYTASPGKLSVSSKTSTLKVHGGKLIYLLAMIKFLRSTSWGLSTITLSLFVEGG